MSTWRPVSRLPRWLAWLPDWAHAPIRWSLRGLLVGLILLAAIATFYLVKASSFDLDKVSQLPAQTTLLDRDGHPIDVSWGTSRHLAQRKDLPEFLIQCIQAREDARFYSHPGVDVRGLLRATVRNVKDGDFTQGASTLTMQLARNTYDMRAKSIHRKLLEIALTLRIEHRYTKDEILTHYLNRIYFGAGCHGIEEASRTYFGKSVSDLNEAESSMLIGIIRGPHIFSPIRNFDGAKDQQNEVLDRMISMGWLTEAGKNRIRNTPITLVPEEQRSSERSFALQAVRSELATILEAGDIRLDGLIVHTTLDTDWQLRLETDITNALNALESSSGWKAPKHLDHQAGDTPAYLQCAAVTLDSRTGQALAWIGGRDFLDSRYDRATGARRDLGTTFEPFIAAAAAERGKRILPGKAVMTGRQLGPLETARLAKRCGLGGPFLETEDLFRGSAATTPEECATALATLASDGKRPNPHLITKLTNAKGEVLYSRNAEPSQAITANAARKACELFTSVGSSRYYYGSTGSDRDAWILRIGPSGATAIWIGYDEPARITTDKALDAMLEKLGKQLAE
mgnify:CR=1 FL=1